MKGLLVMSEKEYNERSPCKLGLSTNDPDSYEGYKGHKYTNLYDIESISDFLDLDQDIAADSVSGTFFLIFSGLAITIFALFKYSLILGSVGITLGYVTAKKVKPIGITIICIGLIAVFYRILYSAPFVSLLN